MNYEIAKIPGDGIGVEVTDAALPLLETAADKWYLPMFELVHGSAPDIDGQAAANPLAMGLSARYCSRNSERGAR